ncbi:MAG TPA: DUF5330 domain-containing protein [Methylomirabilota bacterium]|nr:DUF5330 domain-containing protein [Methylomirabilota bacterium]
MFLIRTAFWLTVIIFLIPVDEEAAAPHGVALEAEPIGAVEAMGAAQTALSDVGGFCDRNPDVCHVGGRVATTFALKARTGALMVYSFLDEQLGGSGEPPAAAPPTGTLTPADLAPAWTDPGSPANEA